MAIKVLNEKCYRKADKKKIIKKFKKNEEELPSFLLRLSTKYERSAPKEVHNDYYLGPIFFGGCNQYHPRPHSVGFESFHALQHNKVSRENLLENVFLQKPVPKIRKEAGSKHIKHLHIKRRQEFQDHYRHSCPGYRTAYVTEVVPPVIDFGETTSKIEAEVSREIPLKYRLEHLDMESEEEFEIVTPSDIREKRRPFMSPEERAAHAHFPKEFATVRVIGPTIPASITITKLPCKKRRLTGVNLLSDTSINNETVDELEKEYDGQTGEDDWGEEEKIDLTKSSEDVEDYKSDLDLEELDEAIDSNEEGEEGKNEEGGEGVNEEEREDGNEEEREGGFFDFLSESSAEEKKEEDANNEDLSEVEFMGFEELETSEESTEIFLNN